ncbi:MAG: hypothetical protein A3H97_17065 [Acidobacteria bacterium RIFCSPLOWO2_02_FULL_65_29]|nr:MAG: hypothetical protein A3H97_17065 [Acidobacteria bacterium RIFCSPLOWO2_02_FULL_65_29]
MRTTALRALAIAVALGPAVVFTQGAKTKPTTATYITKEDVDNVNKTPGTDRNLKVVDIGHENFTVGVIHRRRTVNGVQDPAPGAAAGAAAGAARGTAPAAAPTPCGRQMATAPPGGSTGGITHDSQTEAYYIISGGGMMFTDGYIVNGRHNLSPNLNGPTCGGVAYDVVKKTVKVGDIIIVPAGVVHGWSDIPDHVDYLSFRPSPGILTAGWMHAVLKK